MSFSGLSDKSLHEACGVFGMLSRKTLNLGQNLYYGLYALQHRGQESAGMAVFDNHQLRIHKDMGLVNQVFSETLLNGLNGQIGIGHTRYATTGASNLDNAQPVVVRTRLGALTLAHNGNLTNTAELAASLGDAALLDRTDSHVMAHCIQRALDGGLALPDAVADVLARCEGAFSLVMATGDTLLVARDPHGLRPLSIGRTPDGTLVAASESCALDIVGAAHERDIAPGELLIAGLDGTMDTRPFARKPAADNLCIFEQVYFSRPDSRLHDQSVYTVRMNLGRRLAQIAPRVEADIVIPVPDSGNVAAVGYSRESGVPYVEGLIKNRYVGRTFIHPTDALREKGIRLKLNPLTDVLRDKRVIVVDDSIVRGNTSRNLVKMLKDCGTREIHLRISSAPVRHPCFYGIDMSTHAELIANRLQDAESIRAWLGVDSLVYLSVQDMIDVTGNPHACTACFSGHYPAGIPANAPASTLVRA